MNLPFHKSFQLQGKSFQSESDLIVFAKEFSPEIANFFKEWFNDSQYIIVNTSGSTGEPKPIKLQKIYMVNSAKATGAFFNLFEETSALLCMSVNFIAGKMMLVRALTLGWHIDIVEVTSNPLEKLDKNYDFSAMVPMQLYNSLNNIDKIKKLIVGGGVVSNELISKIKYVKTEVFATYGMTETITHIAVKKLNYSNQASYKLLPNIKISIDTRGCLVIEAPTISNDLVVTNDLVEIISANEFNWLGRFDTIINSGGIKLIPEQIEFKLSTLISNRFFVTGIKDAVLGEKLILVVEGEKNNNLLNEIKNSTLVSVYEKPKEIYFTSNFIETETSKVNRKETLELIKNIY